MTAIGSTAGGLRPLGIGEILDAAMTVYRKHFKSLTLAVLALVLPLSIISTLIQASTLENAFNFETATTTEDEGAAIAGQLVTALISLLAFAAATAACFHGVIRGYLGEGASWQESLRFGLRRLLPMIGLVLLFVVMLIPMLIVLGILIAIFPPLVLVGLPAIAWFLVRMSVAAPALLAEKIGAPSAIGRSFRLVEGRWWPTFGALVAMAILVFVLQLLIGFLMGVVFADADNEVLVATVLTLITALGYAVTLPIQAAVFTILYYDLRVRKEGYDLQLAASGMGDAAAPSPSAPVAFGAPSPAPVAFAEPGVASEPAGAPAGFSPPEAPSQPAGASEPAEPPSEPAPGFSPPETPSEAPEDPSEPGPSAPPPAPRQQPPGGGSTPETQ